MNNDLRLTIGTSVSIEKEQLQSLINELRRSGYRTVGPQVRNAAIVYDDLNAAEQLPIGLLDEQDGGRYRLHETSQAGWFDYVVGPFSLKNFLFPPKETLLQLNLGTAGWQVDSPALEEAPLAVIGVRSCDLHALEIQDRVFLNGPFVDPRYKARREQLFTVAVNCRRAAATCFCHSMRTGPAVTGGFDLALTEFDSRFIVEIGSDRGAAVLRPLEWTPCSLDEVADARNVPRQLEELMHARTAEPDQPPPRQLDTNGIRDLLLDNPTHPHWHDVAARCLACANCTMVCPTCFCSTVKDVTDLTGEHVTRERTWASCFTNEHSYTSSGVVRASIQSQYRQWLTHKLASWIDQFDTSGCVGCGRCITWCPVGIDLTAEVAAIRQEAAT